MRKVIFIIILSTVCGWARAQSESGQFPVRLIVTSNFQRHLFGRDPLWRSWPEGSLSRALSYVESWRREMGEDRLVLVNVGAEVEGIYALYPEDLIARVSSYARYASTQTLLPQARLDSLAAALDRDGRTIGVVDFTAPGVCEARTVDISGFPVYAPYEDHFKSLTDSILSYYETPIARFAAPAGQAGFLLGPTAYTALFQRFQLAATGAEVSFFAVPRTEEAIPAGELTFGDIVRRFRYDNALNVIELAGDEIRLYLEYAYGLRYNTMRRPTDDPVRMARDADGVLRTRSAVYNLDEAAGIRYEVDITRPAGRRIRILSLADGAPFERLKKYRVALNSHRLTSGYLTRATGLTPEQIAGRIVWTSSEDLRTLLRDWLEVQGEIAPESLENWRVLPEAWIKERE